MDLLTPELLAGGGFVAVVFVALYRFMTDEAPRRQVLKDLRAALKDARQGEDEARTESRGLRADKRELEQLLEQEIAARRAAQAELDRQRRDGTDDA